MSMTLTLHREFHHGLIYPVSLELVCQQVDFLCPTAEHRHARPAALGTGIENKVIAAVQDSIHRIRAKRFQLLNKISVYNALHIRKDNGIALGQLLQPTKMVIVVMCHDHQIICTG